MHPEPDDPPRWTPRWWMARLAFSFLILGGVAGYEAWRASERGQSARAAVLIVAAAAGISLGVTGMRLRHRR